MIFLEKSINSAATAKKNIARHMTRSREDLFFITFDSVTSLKII